MNRTRTSIGVAAIACLTATPAMAEFELFNKDGWSFSTNGRANGFYSYEFGDYEPTGGTPGMGGIVETPFQAAPDADPSKFSVSRIHTGFVGSILGFTVRKEISETLRASMHMEVWWPIETDQFKGYSSMVPDPRESYARLEGSWGAIDYEVSIEMDGNTRVELDVADGNDRQIDNYARYSHEGIAGSTNLGQFVQIAVVSVTPH